MYGDQFWRISMWILGLKREWKMGESQHGRVFDM